MNANEKYLVEVFKENFNDIKGKNIFLYGTGVNTEVILRNFSDYNIIGLLDGIKKNEYHLGKYIYDINDIMKEKPDVIIIIARPATVKIITKRIKSFCMDNNVRLTDVHNTDLLASKFFNKDDVYFEVNKADLLGTIDNYENISFDIFDTLLMRKVLFPQDVFAIIARKNSNLDFDFKKKRIEAEYKMLEKTNPTIDQIYDELANSNGLSVELVNSLKFQEIEIEKSVLVPRKEMLDVFEYAKKCGKKVYLISDMYLTKNILEEILVLNGISGYDGLFVSCEYGVSKTNGLFNEYLNSISCKNCLHIGDNSEADGVCAEYSGIKSYLIKSSYDMANISSYEKILEYSNDLKSNLYIGTFLSKVFNSPFALYKSKGKYELRAYTDLTMFVAPIIAEFFYWFINDIKQSNYESVLFAARDGFLIKNIYDSLKKKIELPQGYYVLVSRSAALISSINNSEDIKYVANLDFSESPERLLEKRFFLKPEKILKYNKNETTLTEYVLLHEKEILRVANEKRENFKQYLDLLGVTTESKMAFFDFASSGTAQMCLEEILGIELFGTYFIRILSDYYKKQKLKINSLQESGLEYEIQTNLLDKYVFIESILTSMEPSLKIFNEDGVPEFFPEYRTSQDLDELSQIHFEIASYVNLLFELNLETEYNYSVVPDVILGLFNAESTRINDTVLNSKILKDEFCARDWKMQPLLD